MIQTWGNDVPHDLGGNTRDLQALRQPHPAEHGLHPDDTETATRRHGRRCRYTGLCILAGTYAVTFIAALAAEHAGFDNPAAHLFAVLTLVTSAMIGAVLLAVGLHERNQRGPRAMSRLAITRIEANAERLDRIETAVSEGLPEALHQANWSGWAAAERSHEGTRTGTDGPPRQRPHMGLVRDPEPHGKDQ